MEFIFIFAEFIFQVLIIHFFEVVEIVRALRVDTLMDGEVFAVFLGDKGAAAMRATEFRQQKRLSSGENLVSQILHRSCPLEPLFL